MLPSRRPAGTTSIPPDLIIHSSRRSRYSLTFAPDRKASTLAGMRAAAAAYSAKVTATEARSSRRRCQPARALPDGGPTETFGASRGLTPRVAGSELASRKGGS